MEKNTMDNTETVQAKSSAITQIQAAQEILKTDHRRGMAMLNDIFREGRLPSQPLNGRTSGQMIAVNIAPGLTPIIGNFLRNHMPWTGKLFNAENADGDNIFWRSSKTGLRLFSPFYRDYRDNDAETMRAYSFRTYVGKGMQDPDRDVLKIDYNNKSNPALSMRRILDELVQVDENFYLGKAHVRWWWGKWQLIFYFALQTKEPC